MPMNTREVEEQLRDRLFQELGDPGPIALDGSIHRFKGEGDRNRDCWYVAYPEGYGAFGSWRLGFTEKFRADGVNTSNHAMRELMERRAFEAEMEKTRKRNAARDRALDMWDRARVPDPSHPYLVAKFGGEIPPLHSCKQLEATLLIPMSDLSVVPQIMNLQRISPLGKKKFLYGGQVVGTGLELIHNTEPPASPLYICEGWATGISLFNSGRNVVVAWNTANLQTAARDIRTRYEDRILYIAADNDQWTEGNPGLTAATNAGIAVNAGIVYPNFDGLEVNSKPTDFNDYINLGGEL